MPVYDCSEGRGFLLSNLGKNLNGRSLWWDLSGDERNLLLGSDKGSIRTGIK